ncbi:Ppx-GppA-domain-containing protein [Pseudovirgaria hyperparasitica]|uniref:Ppx-GppA-domain-containing protein n=1 Tax=Pseudovirgaria hyperparasitica TaxID=470096 RepID=A0A6A6VSX8_9PEZI|nr:Ppx-GppA-domain-containing protein [Pseudovirgaria hyperparasitica]KAF2753778.1 Ppx-GppA-domain-containing protein [Pseudovirgaria hyperparasitica]
MPHLPVEKPGYKAIVDMGSNGIRFSITDTSPEVARILPVIYQHRTGISLYDAQWQGSDAIPIPSSTINEVTAALKAFQRTCAAFGVPKSNVRIVATEATRTAKNSVELQQSIKHETGLDVEMYPKDTEGLVGAYGVASSFDAVRGLVMDLGGGSTQITWLVFPDHDHPEKVSLSDKFSVSMPYGAAALLRRLREAEASGADAVAALKSEITTAMKDAVHAIGIPDHLLADADGKGLNLYLSGGGFRGWGFVQMHTHPVQPYPIPLINGFRIAPAAFYNTSAITSAVASLVSDDHSAIFRVSARRATQVPAVALLVECLLAALPTISDVFFAQGGVREGTLFRELANDIRTQDPLHVASAPFAPPHAHLLAPILSHAIPSHDTHTPGELTCPYTPADISAFAGTLYMHAALPSDVRAAAALRSTTTGALAGTHGLSHVRRAELAVLLCESYGGRKALTGADLVFYTSLVRLLPAAKAWWVMYLGRVAGVVRGVWPAGVVVGDVARLSAGWVVRGDGEKGGEGRVEKEKEGKGEKEKEKKRKVATVRFELELHGPEGAALWTEDVQGKVRAVEKAGKRKHWVDLDTGFGVDVVVRRSIYTCPP